MTDYKSLLKRYMKHVGFEEGCTFIPYYDPDYPVLGDVSFTQVECDELQAMEDEIVRENEAASPRTFPFEADGSVSLRYAGPFNTAGDPVDDHGEPLKPNADNCYGRE